MEESERQVKVQAGGADSTNKGRRKSVDRSGQTKWLDRTSSLLQPLYSRSGAVSIAAVDGRQIEGIPPTAEGFILAYEDLLASSVPVDLDECKEQQGAGRGCFCVCKSRLLYIFTACSTSLRFFFQALKRPKP